METNSNGASGQLSFDEKMCERYLFGELNEAEQERFETAYFTDDSFFDRFLAVKTELLDLYARGELTPQKRTRMESHFLTTAPRQKHLAEFEAFNDAVTAIAGRKQHRTASPTTSISASAEKTNWMDELLGLFTIHRLAGAATVFLVGFVSISYVIRDRPDETAGQIGEQPQITAQNASESPTNMVESPLNESETVLTGSGRPEDVPTARSLIRADPKRKSQPKVRKIHDQPRVGNNRPVNERANTGFALTLSTVGRDNGRPVGPAPTSGLRIGGSRERDGTIDLKGRVLDPNGNGINAAEVTARNIATGQTRTMTASSDGTYRFGGMPPGKYEISTTAATLKRSVISPIELSAVNTYELDIALQPGAQDTVVNVTGDSVADTSASVVLTARTRDLAGSNVLKIYADTETVNISLSFARFDLVSYDVAIETLAGRRIVSEQRLTLEPEMRTFGLVPLQLNAKIFKAGDHIVKLSGRTKAGISEVISEYYLKVQRIASKTP